MNERTYRLRVRLVKKLRRQCAKSWDDIAKECHVHPGTIKRWLAGREVYMHNIGVLARALNTTADQIILPEGEEDLTDYIDAEMTLNGDLATLEQPKDITAILDNAQKAIGGKYRILLMYVGNGSIKLGIRLHAADAMRLVRAFIQGRLEFLLITSVAIKSHLQAAPVSKACEPREPMESLLTTCPSGDTLRAYALGKLDHAWAEAVARHVDTCTACQAFLDGLDDGPGFLQQIRI
jgi:hypothetical protein